MSNTQGVTQSRRLTGRKWGRRLLGSLSLKAAQLFLQGGMTRSAQACLALRLRLLQHLPEDDLTALLVLLAEFEYRNLRASFEAGRRILALLDDSDSGPKGGRVRLLSACVEARKQTPKSLYLLQLQVLTQSLLGDYRCAAAEVEALLSTAPRRTPDERRRFTLLRECWSVADQIAYAHVDWANNEEVSDAEPISIETATQNGVATTSKAPTESMAEAGPPNEVEFKEHLLQRRDHEQFLASCLRDFQRAATLLSQINAIRQMLRIGMRRMPDYSAAYTQAGVCLDKITPKIDSLRIELKREADGGPSANSISLLCRILPLAYRLNRVEFALRIRKMLKLLVERPTTSPKPWVWMVCSTLAAEPTDRSLSVALMKRVRHQVPKNTTQLRDFFRWAVLTSSWTAAEQMKARLPKKLRRDPAMLHYAEILQRQSRFGEARKLVTRLYAEMLARPAKLRPNLSYRTLLRLGEQHFFDRTRQVYRQVPQPQAPCGMVLILARNIHQLRSYPLLALREFKARGWVVVPLVEGLLPRELSGIPEIDLLNGAISRNATLQPHLEGAIPDQPDFIADLDHGQLRWGDIDLSHALWEDAAINRRRYSIHWRCPTLQSQLSSLLQWSRSTARTLAYARRLHEEKGLRVGVISLFNHRLPDCIPRFLCERHGDPDGFFFMHAANGYQNYFTNFATNISERFVLRNMTRYPNVRSASFPIPENFIRYYETHRAKAADLLARHESITRVRRSTAGQMEPPPEAVEVSTRIADWRAGGGKVACAFGKVVCDSSVPFDGGPTHSNMKEWINHCIRTVRGSNTLLLIKPHPHELNNQIATFPTEFFRDLIEEPMDENVIFLGHRWFDMADMETRMDLGLIYNGTTSIELGIMGIPCLLAGHFAPVDYPIGHVAPQSKAEFEAYLRFEKAVLLPPDIRERAAAWLHYMGGDDFTLPYRFHSRPVTNKKIYPPYWFEEDIAPMRQTGNSPMAVRLVDRVLGLEPEPGGVPRN